MTDDGAPATSEPIPPPSVAEPATESTAHGLVKRTRYGIDTAKHRADELYRKVEGARPDIPALDATFDAVVTDRLAGGGLLAGALAFRLFVWLVPLALVLVVGLGFVGEAAHETPEQLAEKVGLTAFVADSVSTAAQSDLRGRWITLVLGSLALLVTTRNLVKALRTSHQLAWHLEVHPLGKTTSSALVFLAGTVGMIAAALIVNLLRSRLGFPLSTIVLAVLGLVYCGAWFALSVWLPHGEAPWTALLPGAALFAVGMEILHLVTVLYLVGHVSHASKTYGALGVAVGLLVWLYLIGRLAVASAVLNATLWRRRTATDRDGPSEASSAPGAPEV